MTESPDIRSKGLIVRLFDLTEITTKVTCVMTFILCLCFLWARGVAIRPAATAVFFAGMFLFDLTTTSINNYIDAKTGPQTLAFTHPVALRIILVMLGMAVALGLWLVSMTDIVVLLVGGLCFLCGILYTAGPMPISRMPLGEAVSGLFYGFVIPFLLFYINLPAGSLLRLSLLPPLLLLEANLWEGFTLVLFAIAPACATANIMLANNTCDIDRDIEMRRHTLPYHIGRKRATHLYAALYALSYLSVIALVCLGMAHPLYLLALVSAIPVFRNVRAFLAEQVREKTFFQSVVNFFLLIGGCIVAMAIAGLWGVITG